MHHRFHGAVITSRELLWRIRNAGREEVVMQSIPALRSFMIAGRPKNGARKEQWGHCRGFALRLLMRVSHRLRFSSERDVDAEDLTVTGGWCGPDRPLATAVRCALPGPRRRGAWTAARGCRSRSRR